MKISTYKIFISVFFIFILGISLSAQKYILLPKPKPEYIGGINELGSFVARNIEYPEEALNNGIVGTVLVGFFIDEEGKISDFEIIKGIGGGCEEEVIRVLKLTEGKWKPAMENGQPVRSFYRIPIAFRLPDT